MLRKTVLFLLLVYLLMGSASATATHSGNTLTITSTMTVQEVYAAINDPSVIDYQNGQYIFYNCEILSVPMYNNLNFSGCNISFIPAWQPQKSKNINGDYYVLNNSVLSNISYIDVDDRGFWNGAKPIENLTVNNLYLNNASYEGFYLIGCKNITIHNFTGISVGKYPDRGMAGATWQNCTNCHAYNGTFDWTGRSGLDFTGESDNCSFENWDVAYCGHAYADFHGQRNCWMKNITFHNQKIDPRYGTSYDSSSTVTVSNGNWGYVNMSNPSAWPHWNNYIQNVTVYNIDKRIEAFDGSVGFSVRDSNTGNIPVYINGQYDFDLINYSAGYNANNSFGFLVGTWPNYPVPNLNCSMVDCNFTGKYIQYCTAKNFRDINTYSKNGSAFYPGDLNKDVTKMYWVTPTVTKEGSTADAYIFVEANDTNMTSANGFGDTQTKFFTTNGRCSYSSEDRNNSIAVAERKDNYYGANSTDVTTYYQHKITAIEIAPTTDTKIKSDPEGFSDFYTVKSDSTLTHVYGNSHGVSDWFTVSNADYVKYPSEIANQKTVPVNLDTAYNRTDICSVVIA